MKRIFEIFIIGIMGVLIFSGVSLINDYMFLKGNLDEESSNLVIQYDNTLNNLMSEYNTTYEALYNNESSLNNVEVEADVNTLDEFVKEYGEAKQKISILRQGMNMITQTVDMVLLSVPFVELDDLKLYRQVLFAVIIFIIGVAIIAALFRKEVSQK